MLDIGADQVLHGGVGAPCSGAQRQAADGADVLCELAGLATLDGPVAGVVDAGGDLVDQQPAAFGDEQLDAKNPDVVERLGDALGARPRGRGESGGDVGRRQRQVEDAVHVAVLDRIEARHPAVRRAGNDHRDLAFDRDQRFQDRRTAVERAVPGVAQIVARRQHDLALSVIAEGLGLENGGTADQRVRRIGIGVFLDRRIGRRLQPEAAHEILFGDAVLRNLERAGARPNRNPVPEPFQRRCRHVLELDGDDIHRRAEGIQGRGVVIGRHGLGGRDLRGGAAGLRREYVTAIAERRGGDRQHPAELAAAENADGPARRDHGIRSLAFRRLPQFGWPAIRRARRPPAHLRAPRWRRQATPR